MNMNLIAPIVNEWKLEHEYIFKHHFKNMKKYRDIISIPMVLIQGKDDNVVK